MPLMLDNGR